MFSNVSNADFILYYDCLNKAQDLLTVLLLTYIDVRAMEDYKGYFISSLAVPTYMTGRKSKSLGIVLKSGRFRHRSQAHRRTDL